MNPRVKQLQSHTCSTKEGHRLTEEGGSLLLLHRLKGKIAVRHLRNKFMPKRQRQCDTQPFKLENGRLDRYTSHIDKPTLKTQPEQEVTRGYKSKILPQLSLDVSLDRKPETQLSVKAAQRNNKMLDLIIDILKDNEKKERSEAGRLQMVGPNNQPNTPVSGPAKGKLCRFNTQPSVEFMPSQELSSKKPGPTALKNEFVKMTLNNARSNMFSEHRSRHSVKVREDIKSSGNSRMKIAPLSNNVTNNNGYWRSMDDCNSNFGGGNVQLLTFYPRGQKEHFVDPLQNEFMNLGELPVLRPKFSK